MRAALLALLALLALALPATACERTLAWERPTAYVSGEPLPVSQIARYEFACGAESGQYTTAALTIPGEVEEYRFACADAVPEFGRWYCALRAASTNGETSDWSNEVVLVNELAPLQAPQFITR